MRINGRIITSLIMLLVFLFFVCQAIFFTPAARMMPLLIGVPGAIISFCQVIIELKTGDRETDGSPMFSGRELSIIAWLAAFIIGIAALGFAFGSSPVVTGYLYFVAKERLRTALIAGIFCFVFMYGLFERLMNMQLFEGLLPQYLW